MSESDGGIVTPLNSWAAAGVARRAAAASVARLRQALTIISSDLAVRLCPCSGRRGPNLKRSAGGVRPGKLEDSRSSRTAIARSTSDTPRKTSGRAVQGGHREARDGRLGASARGRRRLEGSGPWRRRRRGGRRCRVRGRRWRCQERRGARRGVAAETLRAVGEGGEDGGAEAH